MWHESGRPRGPADRPGWRSDGQTCEVALRPAIACGGCVAVDAVSGIDGNDTVFTDGNTPNGIRDVVNGGGECGEPVVVDRNHRKRKHGLFGGEALVGRDQGGESVRVGACKEFVVPELTPMAEHGALDGDAAKRIPEGASQAMRDSDIEKHLHSWLPTLAFLGAAWSLSGGGADRLARGEQHRGSSASVDTKVAYEVVKRHAIRKPVE